MPGQRPGQLLQFICLALLAEEPASGYDIRRKILAAGLEPFVPHGQATVYSALKALEAAGKVASERCPGQGRPDQKLFRLLPEGQAELRPEVLDPDDDGTIPILLRFQGLAPGCALRAVVEHQLDKASEAAMPEQRYPDPALTDWRTRASESYWRWRVDSLRELLEVLPQE